MHVVLTFAVAFWPIGVYMQIHHAAACILSLTAACNAGVKPAPIPALYEGTLLLFNTPNVTFSDVQLRNVDAWYLISIFTLAAHGNVVSQLVSTGCNSNTTVVAVKNTPGQMGLSNETVTIGNASISNTSAEALDLYNSNVNITGSTFRNISGITVWAQNCNVSVQSSTFTNSTQGLAIQSTELQVSNSLFDSLNGFNQSGAGISVNNSDGSSVEIGSCSFTNNIATGELDGALG